MLWHSVGGVTALLPGESCRMYYDDWEVYREFVIRENAIRLAYTTETLTRHMRYAAFY